jgi:hypothetical protein
MAASKGSETAAAAAERHRWRMFAAFLERQQKNTLLLSLLLLAVGFVLIWLAKSKLGVEGDAIFITLLLVPLVVYLAFTGQISAFSFPGGRVDFNQLKDHVAQVGRLEPERTAFLGKLAQVHEETEGRISLLYADVDGLRQRTRAEYNKQRREFGPGRPDGRRTEESVRKGFIQLLEFAFVDAFYAEDVEGGKADVFQLQEPDLVMILRGVETDVAGKIAREACRIYSGWTEELPVTVAVLPPKWPPHASPEDIDRVAQESLESAKDLADGEVYLVPERKLWRRALSHSSP